MYNLGDYQPPAAKSNRKDWYHGSMDRHAAVALLKEYEKQDGAFLVRRSGRKAGAYVLTMVHMEHVYNFQICKKVSASAVMFVFHLFFIANIGRFFVVVLFLL